MKHLILSLLFIISIYPANSFGQCVKGDCKNGPGTYKYSDGTEYKGQWKNGRLDGQGTLTYPDGSKYVGQFKDNRRNGQGTYTYPDNSKYVGQFKDNYRNRQGTYTYSDGSKYVGQWKDGKKHGQGTYILPGGDRQVGRWNNNKFIENPKSYKVHKYTPKKMTEERSRKAESSKSLKISTKSSKKRYHMVKAGETLYSISYRYGLTVKKIQLQNKLFDRSVIYPGQKLLVTF